MQASNIFVCIYQQNYTNTPDERRWKDFRSTDKDQDKEHKAKCSWFGKMKQEKLPASAAAPSTFCMYQQNTKSD